MVGGEDLSGWEEEDAVKVLYLDEGIYEVSKEGMAIRVVLSDPAHSDLRLHPIFKELEEPHVQPMHPFENLTDLQELLEKGQVKGEDVLYDAIFDHDLERAELAITYIADLNAPARQFRFYVHDNFGCHCSPRHNPYSVHYDGNKKNKWSRWVCRDAKDCFNSVCRHLNHAITREDLEMVALLLKHDAKPRISNSAGYAKEILTLMQENGSISKERIKNMEEIMCILKEKK